MPYRIASLMRHFTRIVILFSVVALSDKDDLIEYCKTRVTNVIRVHKSNVLRVFSLVAAQFYQYPASVIRRAPILPAGSFLRNLF